MPYARNRLDGVRTYFEDWGGDGPPVVVYAGLADPLQWSQSSGLAGALHDDFRLVFADHRGQGRSDKPYEVGAYSLPTRCADVIAVLDTSGIDRAHFIGFSWGARLGFAVGEHAPNCLLSLVLCGNQPYEWDTGWPFVQGISTALAASRREGTMEAFVESLESWFDERLPEPVRTWTLENDPAAIDAAWRSALAEGPVSEDLTAWSVPCLIYAGADDPMHDSAERAAAEIPGATFLSLARRTHLSAADEVNGVLPHVVDLFNSVSV